MTNTDKKQKIGEVADLFKVSTVTIRNWVNLLGVQYLSPDANRKTGKRFSPGDISTLQKFRSLLLEGVTWKDALSQLPTMPEIVAETPEEIPPGTTTTAIQTLQMLERLQGMLTLQAEQHQETIKAKDEHIETLKAENTRLQAEIDRLKTPWYKRLFTK
jgi:DNA-binding transcriptional MerR regulator